MFERYLDAWRLVPDGAPAFTRGSALLPVRRGAERGMLKIALHAEEKSGAALMAWWDGDGAARVLASDGTAILLERADNQTSLVQLSADGADDKAVAILCATIARLHAPRSKSPPPLTPLTRWFRDLLTMEDCSCPVVRHAAETTRELLDTTQDVVILHGDIHHGNVLHFGRRGWLAIDPKGLSGERGFDYANIFCNPDHRTATSRARFRHRLGLIAEAAALDPVRLNKWVLAWAALSTQWHRADDSPPETSLAVARLAAAELVGSL
jgi:streptomycin 6-kinase